MKNKKVLIPVAILVTLIVIAGVIMAVKNKNDQSTEPAPENRKKRITEPVNIIETNQRPFVKLSPVADGHNLTIEIFNTKKRADTLEYELEYQAGSLLQGVFGQIDLAQLPVEEKILLGSCSAGGACTYHQDVKGGSLLMRFSGGEETYALKSDWRYFINSSNETSFSSRDAKFTVAAKQLARQSYIIIYNSPGYPVGLEELGQLNSEIYSLATNSSLTGEGEITIRANQEAEDLTLVGFNTQTQEWTEFEATVEGKMVTAPAAALVDLYAVVK